MCIIIAKPQGAKMPKEDIFKRCFERNPDGSGLAYYREGDKSIRIVKGFMDYPSLLKSIRRLCLGRKDACLFHFRLATHGLADEGNCHPFPISDKISELRNRRINVNIAVAHNGIFSDMPQHNTLSDTQKFIRLILSHDSIKDNITDGAVRELLKGYCGSSSRLAFITNKGEIVTIGNWVKDKGIYYSNEGFKEYRFERYSGFASWDDEYIKSDKQTYAFMECDSCGNIKDVHYNQDFKCVLCDDCESDLSV